MEKSKRPMTQKQAFLEHGKLPPQAIDLEEAVLGAMMLERDSIGDVIGILTENCFYKDQHQAIFKAICSLYDKNQPVDILTVANYLKNSGDLEMVGGPYYITQLTSRIASSSNIEYHSSILLEKSIKREMIRVGTEMVTSNFDDNSDCFDNLDNADRSLMEISSMSVKGGTSTSIKDAVAGSLELLKLREKAVKENTISGITTGLKDLNKKIYGWKDEKFYIIAGRPGMGKTASMVHFAKSSARSGKHAVIFELEMTKEELSDRLISSECPNVPFHKYNQGYISHEDRLAIINAADRISKLPIEIDDKPGISFRYLKSRAKILKKQGKCDIVFIDYLQLMDLATDKKNRNRENEVSEASRALKNLARDLKVPVIAYSQLSREVEKRPGKRPQLSDLRESGSLEQDADVVIFIYRPEYYKETNDNGVKYEGEALFDVAKHRGGPTGEVYFKYNESLTNFYDFDAINVGGNMYNVETVHQTFSLPPNPNF